MAAAHCVICLNHCQLDPEKFEIFPCGHGFCTTCIASLFSADPRPKCPNCRVILHQRDSHPVYIELIDAQTFMVTSVVEGLNNMGPNTPLISVKKASQKLGKIADGSNVGTNNLSLLLKALEEFNERILPMFAMVETQKHEIDSLRNDIRRHRREKEHLKSKVTKIGPLQAEIGHLKTTLSETERNTDEALRLAENAKDELAALHATTNQWKKRATELEQENKRYKDMLDRHANAARLQKEKNRKLTKQVASLTEQLAKEEKALMSIKSHAYDGDFSGHGQSRIDLESIFPGIPLKRNSVYDENSAKLDVEGMPPSNFPSEWQLEGRNVLKKQTLNGNIVSGHRRVANPFPIDLDRKGHPTRAVQLGPKSIVHIGR